MMFWLSKGDMFSGSRQSILYPSKQDVGLLFLLSVEIFIAGNSTKEKKSMKHSSGFLQDLML